MEDSDNALILKVSTTTWFKPIPESERPATPEPEWTIPSNDFPEPENNWANTYATTYQVPTENKLQKKTYDIGSFIKWFCRQTGKKKLCKADLEMWTVNHLNRDDHNWGLNEKYHNSVLLFCFKSLLIQCSPSATTNDQENNLLVLSPTNQEIQSQSLIRTCASIHGSIIFSSDPCFMNDVEHNKFSLAPQRQENQEKTDSPQQGLEFLFSPLLEEYYNPTHGQAEENNNNQAPNASFQEDEFINPFCTRVQEIDGPEYHPLNKFVEINHASSNKIDILAVDRNVYVRKLSGEVLLNRRTLRRQWLDICMERSNAGG
ncbi:hypothetical protein Tco_0255055 [Tanacetum coccineum]